MKNKSIVFITSGQPSVNPRLVKEADALSEEGFAVTVIYQYWNSWATDLDRDLLKTRKWKAVRAGGDPSSKKFLFFLSRLIHKLTRQLYAYFGNIGFLPEAAISRTSLFLLWEARKIKADFYIGHNLGALPAVVSAAKLYNKPCGFDAEDFHRYETSNDDQNAEVKLKKHIEGKYIPYLTYLSAASPLIAEEYKKLFPQKPVLSILNVFPGTVAIKTVNNPINRPLRLFWFSQTIGCDRGLEDIIKAIGLLPKPELIELHLLGSVNSETKQEFSSLFTKANLPEKLIYFYEPIDSDQIINFASQFDVGLAAETGFPFNRDICLTNKIFTYIQAGLAILASDTAAQQKLLNEYENLGFIYQRNNVLEVKNILTSYLNNPDLLDLHKNNCLYTGSTILTWNNEKIKFLQQVTKFL